MDISESTGVDSNGKNLHDRKQQQQKLGEDAGVARSGPAVTLESDTAASGRRCDNSSCLVVEGAGVQCFKRCGVCKQRWYCSAHCQVSPVAKQLSMPSLLVENVCWF